MDANPTTSGISPKRRQIVAAAEALFLANGYGNVSMDAIARSAVVSKATLYAHFASKDALFGAIMADQGRDAPSEADMLPDHVGDMRHVLTHIGQRVMRFMLLPRTLAIYRVAVAESARFPELGRAFYEGGPQRFSDRFRAWIDLQAAAGHLSGDDSATAAHQFMALLRSCVFLRASLAVPPAPDDAEIDRTVCAAVDTFLAAFGRNSAV